MSDIDKQYINYNLSLVDPQNINVETPDEAKEDIAIEIETPDEDKSIIYVDSNAEFENKPADGGSLKSGLSFSDLGLAREFPMEPIDPEISVSVIAKEEKPVPGVPSATYTETAKKDFKVTEDNKGKDDTAAEVDVENEKISVELSKDDTAITADLGGSSPEIDVKVLNKNALIPKTKGIAEKATVKTSFDTVKVSDGLKLKEDNVVDFMNLSPFLTGPIAKTPYTKEELTYDEVVKKLNIKGQISNLGAMHVYPSNPNEEGGILSKYEIPFEFNPNISESGRGAKFEATSLLSRVGDIQSYIKTENASIQLTTKYQVLSVDQETNAAIPAATIDSSLKGDHQGMGTWMEAFHLRNVQSIEMAYRGLVFPQLAKEGGSYFRPPLVKIVFGNTNEINDGKEVGTTPFNSLLTYPYKFSGSTKMYHKSFIVTKVDIKKDWDSTPLILNENNNGILDLQGFSVTLSLMEVDPMYIGVLPSFEDYYSIAKEY